MAQAGRGAGGCERVAGAVLPRWDAARERELIDLGVRARPARGRDPATRAGGHRQGGSQAPALRTGTASRASVEASTAAAEPLPEATLEQAREAHAWAAEIDSEELRKTVEKAARASLARAGSGRSI